MSTIVKVILRGESPLQNPRVIWKDRLVMEPTQISYQYRPLFKSDRDPVRIWEHSVEDAAYTEKFDRLCRILPEILAMENPGFDHDMPVTEFEAVMEDGTKSVAKFWVKKSTFTECFDIVEQMIPTGEELPNVLAEEEE